MHLHLLLFGCLSQMPVTGEQHAMPSFGQRKGKKIGPGGCGVASCQFDNLLYFFAGEFYLP